MGNGSKRKEPRVGKVYLPLFFFFFFVLFLLGDKDKEIHDIIDCEPKN